MAVNAGSIHPLLLLQAGPPASLRFLSPAKARNVPLYNCISTGVDIDKL